MICLTWRATLQPKRKLYSKQSNRSKLIYDASSCIVNKNKYSSSNEAQQMLAHKQATPIEHHPKIPQGKDIILS